MLAGLALDHRHFGPVLASGLASLGPYLGFAASVLVTIAPDFVVQQSGLAPDIAVPRAHSLVEPVAGPDVVQIAAVASEDYEYEPHAGQAASGSAAAQLAYYFAAALGRVEVFRQVASFGETARMQLVGLAAWQAESRAQRLVVSQLAAWQVERAHAEQAWARALSLPVVQVDTVAVSS